MAEYGRDTMIAAVLLSAKANKKTAAETYTEICQTQNNITAGDILDSLVHINSSDLKIAYDYTDIIRYIAENQGVDAESIETTRLNIMKGNQPVDGAAVDVQIKKMVAAGYENVSVIRTEIEIIMNSGEAVSRVEEISALLAKLAAKDGTDGK